MVRWRTSAPETGLAVVATARVRGTGLSEVRHSLRMKGAVQKSVGASLVQESAGVRWCRKVLEFVGAERGCIGGMGGGGRGGAALRMMECVRDMS